MTYTIQKFERKKEFSFCLKERGMAYRIVDSFYIYDTDINGRTEDFWEIYADVYDNPNKACKCRLFARVNKQNNQSHLFVAEDVEYLKPIDSYCLYHDFGNVNTYARGTHFYDTQLKAFLHEYVQQYFNRNIIKMLSYNMLGI